ncbi:peptidase S8 [Clostridium botulinum]|uniref:S8 family peptidase n=1 Tax=Clostridium botulinum TaxID=1491 RepID=UPI0001F84A72|nr:S8 family serine peptidase [Clostridium botulinum]KEI84520.1 peptidase S8 [Clostridium botulinum B2 275]NFB18048.1 peptidase S8 [Clostridium botulinum]NFB69062.1 peptidase S8 [Clostridium botulinum]NFB98593.1 peptidase S8 [Clostridium botulinum]NFC47217.1 peptidase S8 [Clostridium botulinum]
MAFKSPIIIIDDGVNSDLCNLGELKSDIEVTSDLEIKENLDCYNEFTYHGSTCAAIIKKYLPNAELGSIKILSNFKGTRYQLVKAIKWCVENNIKLINLSLGTVNFQDFKLLYSCMEYAYKKGLIIIAAYNNKRIYTCPASFDNVIGVKCDTTGTLKSSEYIYNTYSLDGIEVIANAKHNIIDNSRMVYTTSICNSYATPVVTALVYELIEKYPDITINEIKTYLRNRSVNNNNSIDLIKRNHKIQKNVDVPLMIFYDFTGYYGATISKLFCELFRANGYYAIAIVDSILKSSKHEGIISFRENYNNIEGINSTVLKDVYSVFNCDILISCIDKTNLRKELVENLNSFTDMEVDIKILIIKNFTIDIKNIIEKNSESEILIFCYTENVQAVKEKSYRVFYNVYELFMHVLRILT